MSRLPTSIATLALTVALFAGCSSPPPAPDAPVREERTSAPLGNCASCGQAIHGRAMEWQGRNYHLVCYDRVGPTCGVCSGVIRGPYVVLAGKLSYHERCLRDAERCEGCGLPAQGERGGVSRWEDGRVTCRICRADAALDSADARQALGVARAALHDLLGLDVGNVATPVVLVTRQELHARAGALAHDGLKALTEVEERSAGDGTRGERRYRIFALKGLPREGLVGVLAHELFHVLQSEASGARQEDALREGAANYIQVRVLRARGEEVRARLVEEDSDQVYGGGVRRVEKLALDKGVPKALDAGLRGVRFPDGY